MGVKSTCVIEWDRPVPLRVPVFHDSQGLAVEWHDYVVAAGVTHDGATPIAGYYKSILWHSGTALECDDFRTPMPLGVDPTIHSTICLIWIVPSRLVSPAWKKPLPMPAHSFVDLLGGRFA